jgi:RNA polymerase sigma-70 factor (ECF subfamily)
MPASVPGSEQEFIDLLTQARQGDTRALGDLIGRYRPYLLKIAYDEGDTNIQAKEGESDIVQDAYVRAIRAFKQFKGQTQQDLRAWLRGILLHQIHDTRERYKSDMRDIAAEVPLEQSVGTLPASESTPSAHLIHDEERAQIEAALLTLSELDRAVIVMRQKDGLSFAQIARHLHQNEDAIRKRWARAIETLEEKVNRPE